MKTNIRDFNKIRKVLSYISCICTNFTHQIGHFTIQIECFTLLIQYSSLQIGRFAPQIQS